VLLRLTAAGVAATVSLALPSELLAGGEWPNGPNKTWFQNLQRPDNNQHPYRQSDPKSLFCCGIADTVKTKFKVEAGNERYPEDRWFAWLSPYSIREDRRRPRAGRPAVPLHVVRHRPVLRAAQGRTLNDMRRWPGTGGHGGQCETWLRRVESRPGDHHHLTLLSSSLVTHGPQQE
jgi:hypothetical protein